MSRLLTGGSVRLSLVLATSLLALPLPAAAQVVCQTGINTAACVNPSGTTLPYVQSTLPGVTIDNRGAIDFDIATTGANSGVTNSGTVGANIYTQGYRSNVTNSGYVGTNITTIGAESSITNSGSVGANIQTFGAETSVTNSGSVGGYIDTSGYDTDVINTGTVGAYIRTYGADSSVTNSGSVGQYIQTGGANSSVTNSGTVGQYIQTGGANSSVTNSGTVGTLIRTNGINSGVTNSGSVGLYIQTSSADSGVTNSGSVEWYIQTSSADSGVTNSGSVGLHIQTLGDDSGVTNSGSVEQYIRTDGINSVVTNSGTVGTYVSTSGANSGVINLGSVGTYVQTFGANSGVTNSGSVGTFIQTTGADSGVTNSGSVGSGNSGDGIFIGGANPTLTLLPGSLIQGGLNLYGSGTRTLNVGNGLSVDLTFDTPPDVVNTFGAPYVQSGNRVVVVDATVLGQHDEMLADLTGGIFNSIHARLGGAGGPAANGFGGGMQLGMAPMMQLGGSNMMNLGSADITPSAPRDTVHSLRGGLWAQAFGGSRSDDADRGAVGSDTKYYGGIAGIDGRLRPGVIIGAFGGASNANLDVDYSSQKLDADSYFGGGYLSFQRGNAFARLMVTAGQSDYDSRRHVANNMAPGGIEIAKASYDGTFVSPELAVGTQFNIGGWTVEPSARGRYAYLSLDGYSERGATDTFSVGDRDVSMWLGRLQLAFPVVRDGATLAPRIGVEAWTSDSDRVSAVLLGEAISFSPGGDDNEVTGFAGVTATVSLGRGAAAYLDSEVHFGDDGFARSEARGGIKINF
ncbi:MAG: autotransporter domain-containing protein [Hyphomicrobiaceae bacterium]|nr:autotransporter domain-containing protein [Hyphomicrobiaceae bacterium]